MYRSGVQHGTGVSITQEPSLRSPAPERLDNIFASVCHALKKKRIGRMFFLLTGFGCGLHAILNIFVISCTLLMLPQQFTNFCQATSLLGFDVLQFPKWLLNNNNIETCVHKGARISPESKLLCLKTFLSTFLALLLCFQSQIS